MTKDRWVALARVAILAVALAAILDAVFPAFVEEGFPDDVRCHLGHDWCALLAGHPGWCEVKGSPLRDKQNEGWRFK